MVCFIPSPLRGFSLLVSFSSWPYKAIYVLHCPLLFSHVLEVKAPLCWVGLFEKWRISVLLDSESRLGNKKQGEMSEWHLLSSLGCHLFAHNTAWLSKTLRSLALPWCCQVQRNSWNSVKLGMYVGPWGGADRWQNISQCFRGAVFLSLRGVHTLSTDLFV